MFYSPQLQGEAVNGRLSQHHRIKRIFTPGPAFKAWWIQQTGALSLIGRTMLLFILRLHMMHRNKFCSTDFVTTLTNLFLSSFVLQFSCKATLGSHWHII
jgi:hypothetical protein